MEASLEYDWFYDALRYSVSATSSTSSGGSDFDDRDPQFRNLKEAILRSRRLLLTYNAILVVLVAFLAVGHWFDGGRKLTPKRRAQRQSQSYNATRARNEVTFDSQNGDESPRQTGEASSSRSSTLEGTESPSALVKTVDEDTPLLPEGQDLKPHDLRKSFLSLIKAALIYQPSPIPIFNKTLPSNGCTLSIMAFISLNIFYTIFNIKYDSVFVFVLADRCGLVFVANLPLLYLLSAKTQPIKLLTGYSYESLNIIHRRLGEFLCFEALLHFIGMTATWYIVLRPNGLDFWRFITHKIILLGLLAFIAYELLYFTSLGSFRQRWYELFLALHVSFQSTALILVFFHHSQSRLYVGMSLGIFLVDRLVYRLGLKSLTTSGTIQVMEDGETVLVSALIPLQKPTPLGRLFDKSILNGWQASDHVFITIPSLGRSHILQAHPFTIISPAPPSLERSIPSDPATLSLLVRSHANSKTGFSSYLLQYALQHTTLTIRLDGPYGAHHARNLLASSSLAILIAGGSGIAVAWPLLNSLVPSLDPEPHPDEPPPSQLIPYTQKLILIWIVHSRLHESWLPKEAIESLRTAAADSAGNRTLNRPIKIEIEVIIPPPTEQAGRPDIRTLVRDLVLSNGRMWNAETSRIGSRWGRDGDGDGGLESENQKYKVGVVASGPEGLAREARNTVAGLVCQGWDVGIRIEKFGW